MDFAVTQRMWCGEHSIVVGRADVLTDVDTIHTAKTVVALKVPRVWPAGYRTAWPEFVAEVVTAESRWMHGARFGDVLGFSKRRILVQLDRKLQPVYVAACNLIPE